MGFFLGLSNIAKGVHWHFSIDVNEEGDLKLIVRLLEGNQDKMKESSLPPLIFEGSPEEFDLLLLEKLRSPAQETVRFFKNEDNYRAQIKTLEEASRKKVKTAQESATAKQPSQPQKTSFQIKAKREKFDQAMKKPLDLAKCKKYRQAMANVPKVSQFPEFEKDINDFLTDLKKKIGGFDTGGATQTGMFGEEKTSPSSNGKEEPTQAASTPDASDGEEDTDVDDPTGDHTDEEGEEEDTNGTEEEEEEDEEEEPEPDAVTA